MTTNMNFNASWMRADPAATLDPARLRRPDMFAADPSTGQPQPYAMVDAPGNESKSMHSIYFGQTQTSLHGDMNAGAPYAQYTMTPPFQQRTEYGSALLHPARHDPRQGAPGPAYDLDSRQDEHLSQRQQQHYPQQHQQQQHQQQQQPLLWGSVNRDAVGTFDRYGVFSLPEQNDMLEPGANSALGVAGDKPDAGWYYYDPSGKEQGPFNAEEMYDWFKAGYFDPSDPSFMVWHTATGEPVPLGKLLQQSEPHKNPFLVLSASAKHPSGRMAPSFAQAGHLPMSLYPSYPPSPYNWNEPWRNGTGMIYPHPAIPQHHLYPQQQQQQQQRHFMSQSPYASSPMIPPPMMDAYGQPDAVGRKNGLDMLASSHAPAGSWNYEPPVSADVANDLGASQTQADALPNTSLQTEQDVLDITQTLSDTKLDEEPPVEAPVLSKPETPAAPPSDPEVEKPVEDVKEPEETIGSTDLVEPVQSDGWTDGWGQETTPKAQSFQEIQEEEAKEKKAAVEAEKVEDGWSSAAWPIDDATPKKAAGTPSTGGSAWVTTVTPTLTLREIQEEEEKAAAKAQKAAAMETTESKNPTSSVVKNPGGWSAVAASHRPATKDTLSTAATPATSTAGRAGSRSAQSNAWDAPKKNASAVQKTPVTASKPSTGVSTSAPSRNKEPSPGFYRWCKQELRDLSQGVSADAILQMFLSFPVDGSSVKMIQDTIEASSSSMDGRRFATEFIKHRKADLDGKFNIAAGDDASFQVVVTKKGKRKH